MPTPQAVDFVLSVDLMHRQDRQGPALWACSLDPRRFEVVILHKNGKHSNDHVVAPSWPRLDYHR